MGLELHRPLCFFDLETTGVNVVSDRIVEIAILKLLPNGNKEGKTHGITDDKVADAPLFHQLANEIYNYIKECDLAGFNSDRFDIPLLAEEFMRAEVDFDLARHKTIDVQTIFHKMEKRTLGAALQFYCDKELINAHSAMADTEATCDVLLAQLERYKELENNTAFLSEFSSHKRTVDVAGFIVYNKEDWLLNADFPLYTKKVLTALRLRKLNSGS